MIARSLHWLLQPALDHWRGAHHWMVTLGVSVIGATIVYGFALDRLPEMPSVMAIACWIGVGAGLLIWQVTGVMRAISANQVAPADVSAVYGGYITILVAVLLIGLKMMDGVTRYLPKPEPGALLVSNMFAVRIDKASGVVSVKGELNYGSNAALADVLKRHPEVKRVVLASEGGQIFAARTMAGQIEARGLDTHADGNCFSACTIAFMAGRNRTLGARGRLGFHRYAISNRFAVQTVDPEAEQDIDLAFFRRRGVKPAFLKEVFQAGHRDIWRPEHKALLAASVITAMPQ